MNLDDHIGRNRRLSLKSVEDLETNAYESAPWNVPHKKEDVDDDGDSHRLSLLMRESDTAAQELLRIAACLSSLNTRLLEASTSSRANASKILNKMVVNGIVMYSTHDEEHVFCSESMQRAIYRSIPKEERGRQHLSIGRSLVKYLTQEELQQHYYSVLRQFRLEKWTR